MAFSRSAIVLATRLPERPQEGDNALDVMTITDDRSGLSFEVAIYGGYRRVRYEIALAWGVKVIKPEHRAAARLMITGPGTGHQLRIHAMTITVETGSGDNASATATSAWLTLRHTPTAGNTLSRHRSGMREAADQGDGLHRGAAKPVSGHQVQEHPAAWPRYGVSIDGYWILTNHHPARAGAGPVNWLSPPHAGPAERAAADR